tara:strand:- start:808 stop:1395 length:588 start_codon:yes stop_codon:yes gene_type:complete
MSFVSGTIGAIMGKKAGDAQSDAARYAADVQWRMYEQSREDLMPFLQASYRALADYEGLIAEGPGSFEDSPYYDTLEHGIGEATTALTRQGLASGVGQGAIGKRLQEYAVPLAARERGNWINEWLATKLGPTGQLATVGPASQAAQNALLTGQGLGQTALYGGEAKASGYLGTGAAISDMSKNTQNALLMAKYLL